MRTETTTNDAPEQGITLKPGARFGEWRIVGKIDEGGFGQVYKVVSAKNAKKFAALKAEPNDVEGGSAIKLEITVLLLLNKGGCKPHIPEVYHSAKRRKFCYMIMSLLGPNLKSLKADMPKERFSVSTWVRIGIQCLYGLKVLHDMGFVHRDVKPANFVLGHQDDAERCRIVHLLDFGLSRSFAIEVTKGKFEARRARGSAEFRGTARYCSPCVHEKYEQGRKDDLWALMYVLIEFNFGLPWQKERDRIQLEIRKLNIEDKVLHKNFPDELHMVIPYLRSLDMYNRPDYGRIHKAMLKLVAKEKIKFSDKLDWETEEQLAKFKKANVKPAPWENGTAFFESDPLGVNEPPAAGAPNRSSQATKEDISNLMKRAKE